LNIIVCVNVEQKLYTLITGITNADWEEFTLGITEVDWIDILNKPTEFPPSAHTHVVADITDFPDLTETLITLEDGAASSDLPTTSPTSLTSILQIFRNFGKWVIEQFSKFPIFITDGDGDKFLSDDGTYKEIPKSEEYTAGDRITIVDRKISADLQTEENFTTVLKNKLDSLEPIEPWPPSLHTENSEYITLTGDGTEGNPLKADLKGELLDEKKLKFIVNPNEEKIVKIIDFTKYHAADIEYLILRDIESGSFDDSFDMSFDIAIGNTAERGTLYVVLVNGSVFEYVHQFGHTGVTFSDTDSAYNNVLENGEIVVTADDEKDVAEVFFSIKYYNLNKFVEI